VHRIKFNSLLQQLLKYDHSERTPYDQVIALMMALLPMVGRAEIPADAYYTRPKSIMPKYDLNSGKKIA
jgi:hypothetical protein